MNKESIVYILQEPMQEKDLSSANKYGKIVYILEANSRPSLSPSVAIHLLTEAFLNFDIKNDFICFAGGDPLVEFLAGIVLTNLQIPYVNRLIWNRERDESNNKTGRGFYLPKKIHVLNTDILNEEKEFLYDEQ